MLPITASTRCVRSAASAGAGPPPIETVFTPRRRPRPCVRVSSWPDQSLNEPVLGDADHLSLEIGKRLDQESPTARPMPRSRAVAVLSRTAIMGAPLATRGHLGAGAVADIDRALQYPLRHLAAAAELGDSEIEPVLKKMPSLSPTLTGMMASETELAACLRAAPSQRLLGCTRPR